MHCRVHGGLGRGKIVDNGVGGGGGHGGKGGDGFQNGSFISGGVTYGNAELPCELGSGSGNDSLASATAGGGIIGKVSVKLGGHIDFAFIFFHTSAIMGF